MKVFNFLLVLIIFHSCGLEGQEKVSKLSFEDQKVVAKAMKDRSFDLESIRKTDSIQNKKIIFYYDSIFSLYEKEIYVFNKNNQLETVQKFIIDYSNKDLLSLFSEKEYTYSKGHENVNTKVWRNGEEVGSDIVEKSFDEQNKLLQKISKSYKKDSKDTIIVKESFKYVVDKLQNTETICIEEFSETRKPKSFEVCDTYLYRNGKISQNKIGNDYVYDDKNRLIKEVKFNKNGKPYFEDLYIYDDKKKMMEHQRYRFNNSKFLVAKDQTFYYENGLIQKKLYFGMSEDDKMLPEKSVFQFYDKNNKERIQVELKSKMFVEKNVPPPM